MKRRQQVVVTLSALAATLSGVTSLYYFAISSVEHEWVFGSIWVVTTSLWLSTIWVATGTAHTMGAIEVHKERNERLRSFND